MKRLGLSALLAVNVIACPVHADELGSKLYAGLGLGTANFSVNRENIPALTGASNVNTSSYNLNVFTGYQFDQFLGIQLDYMGGGSLTVTSQGKTNKLFDVSLITISATMGAPLNDSFRIYAKLGGTSWRFSSQQDEALNDGFGPSAGLGADINLYGSSERRLRVEYNYYHLDKVYVKNASSLSVNAVFYFSPK